ncbi:hypothetical protein DTO166G4_9174 [Paecilomyces variotii]|nr:hypothetical protein DTO166G4_9174 [Paecilomyces variotii]KAJ9220079.1 hypothetical protein DTO169C6_7625 [Paecilomyces variotii]KAJ9227780.1 hypothetical protein DTO166G5_9159 [Paecilomyces variotii]KAJ9247910.1 hypothetical protein DTO195F2_8988 [Paecilomyces variotii]KAJ9257280.1 hypothetical protein DTO207G8_2034 [Paecilomyces variotii]
MHCVYLQNCTEAELGDYHFGASTEEIVILSGPSKDNTLPKICLPYHRVPPMFQLKRKVKAIRLDLRRRFRYGSWIN